MAIRSTALTGALLVVAAGLTGCVGATDYYADVRDRLAADPAILYVGGSDSSMPEVTNVSQIKANIRASASTEDIQRVAEIVRAELEPLSDEGPDPEVIFEIGPPTDDFDVVYPRLELSEFTIDQPTLAAEIAYWRDLDAATKGAAREFAIQFPVDGVHDYRRTIAFAIVPELPSAARISTFRVAASVDDPSGVATHWVVVFAPPGLPSDFQDRELMASYLGLPSEEVLQLWESVLVPLPGGGEVTLESEAGAPLADGEPVPTSMRLRVEFPDDPAAWGRLVDASARALAIADHVSVFARSPAFGVYVSASCDDGQVKPSDRDLDRSAELIAALGTEGARLGICDD